MNDIPGHAESTPREDAARMAEYVIADEVITAVAARAATGVAGVVRLHVGVAALLGELARRTRHLAGGGSPGGGGISIGRTAAGLVLELELVTDARDQAAAVAIAVQQAVARAVNDAIGLAVASVAVRILDIEVGVAAGHRDRNGSGDE